jgi:putative transposase
VTIYRHISEAKKAKELPVSRQCELLGVSESGFWAWCKRAPSDRALHDAWLTERIRAVHAASKGRYGSPRVHAMLRRQGIRVGEKRVERLMRAAGLQGAFRRRRKGCTVPVEGVEPFGDLVGREFRPDAPNRVWAADIKQIRTGEGWLYLAAVQDLYSRRIVGWAMAGHMRQELVVAALEMAVRRRRPSKGTIHHSDHGGQTELNRSSQQRPRGSYRLVRTGTRSWHTPRPLLGEGGHPWDPPARCRRGALSPEGEGRSGDSALRPGSRHPRHRGHGGQAAAVRYSSSISAGVRQPSVLRGRMFKASATAARSSGL